MKEPKDSTILIVDDEEDLREAIAFDFKRLGFKVLTAECGNDAFKITQENPIDVILSDVRMPNGDGVELLSKIKEQKANLPVVMFLTGFTDLALEEAYDRGADAVFAKPFDRKALQEAVLKALQPPDVRYHRASVRVDLSVPAGIQFKEQGISVEAEVHNIARGGFFAGLKEAFPKAGEEVSFSFQIENNPNLIVRGSGMVRWVRTEPKDEFSSGCGVEFTHLEPDSLKRVIEMINFVKTKSYIPRN